MTTNEQRHTNLTLEVPGGEREVLLHTCCAPCSSAIIECLLENGIRPVIFYYNPNIYPLEEYEIRKAECTRYAKALGLEIVDGDYDHAAWRSDMEGMEHEPERGSRCLSCFQMRLFETARYAAERGLKVFTTTLASSRWKSLEQIHAAGRYAMERHPGTLFWEQNWRKGGLSERRKAIIAEHNFYNQTYCGCEFSQK
ncbi:putative adenine nucleotide alpha hydrolase (AANH) superfamily ATPase [Parabacteroides sp. PFB2-10]|uniref:epoxyqueuosine reductase QueH n=1 Tax=Parabacteroides sp. PFB2-10 TaxID=1742405 RepID=UPI002475D518|nr:epoxyqueuosine reductase QueH [Parabacteroides sp. PFB2-10]MDH6313761.1 putative adenine nucleotide alpha hydrolase (AANH) superfamily ATPase [Parabacteroides sp. PFB2-10]MDL2244578.1 epoxyqueuosine reductase QueH [Parabacteroides sp. OttesenSCG-928-J18]